MLAVYDTIVIGAGVEGSSTAYNLAKAGQRTLLLEQFPLPHSRGSSHGHSRITRKAYTQDFYVRVMPESYKIWSEVEKQTGTTIYIKTGLILIGPHDGGYVSTVENATRSSGGTSRRLSPAELKTEYPQLSYPGDFGAVYDGDGGILIADKALNGLQRVFTECGGEIRSGEKMTSLFPGETVTVRTTKGSYKCRSVAICAGPWAPQILKPLGLHLPLKPIRVTACYWQEKTPGVYCSNSGFPCFIDPHGARGLGLYGLPAAEYPGHMKIALHTGPDANPDARDDVDDGWVVEATAQYVREHFPGLKSDRPSFKEACMYTVTPDDNPVLDTHPHWKNIVIGVGFSGHGFKMAPVVGKVLSELAQGKTPSYDLTPFRIQRFFTKSAL